MAQYLFSVQRKVSEFVASSACVLSLVISGSLLFPYAVDKVHTTDALEDVYCVWDLFVPKVNSIMLVFSNITFVAEVRTQVSEYVEKVKKSIS